MAVTAKKCSKCGATKPLEDFSKNRRTAHGRHPTCKKCKNSAAAGYYQRWTPEQRDLHRARVIKSRYGIEVSLIHALYEKQEGCCAICGRSGERPAESEKRKAPKGVLCVDHCHETGEVRGLLCRSCNLGIGCFSDDVGRLAAATSYLIRGGA